MKKRRSLIPDINVDFTSLLDVIFILLMCVMCYAITTGKKTPENITVEVNPADVNENIAFITICCPYSENVGDSHSRTLSYRLETYDKKDDSEANSGSEDVGGPDEHEFNDANEAEEKQAFTNELIDFVETNKNKPILVSINEEKILYRDHLWIEDLIKDLCETKGYNNIYYNAMDSDGDTDK